MSPEEVEVRSLQRSKANQHRIYLIGAFVLVALLLLAANLQRQTSQLDHLVEMQATTLRLMCTQRQANILKANSNWDALTAIEEHNRFIDDKLRNERLAVFRNAKLIVPDCNY